MKAKNIRSVLRRKIADWTERIKDVAVRKLVEKNTIVTGGAIASMLLGEDVHDFDIYFRNRETTLAVAHYYVGLFARDCPPRFKDALIRVENLEDRVRVTVKSAGVAGEAEPDKQYRYFEQDLDPESLDAAEYAAAVATVLTDEVEKKNRPKYRPIFLTANAISLSSKLQLITRFFGSPDEIHANYDYVHCMCYWVSHDEKTKTDKLVLPAAAMEALLARDLRYVGSRYPICSVIRMRKFVKRGWTISAGQVLKMAWQMSQLDLEDLGVLEEQLTGVDFAYFVELIDVLREAHASGKTIDYTYVCEIIDRIF